MNIYGAYILGNLEVSGSIIGTASLAVSSSYATTASFALNGGGGGSAFPFTGSAAISGSLVVTGSLTVVTGSSIELQVTNTGVRIGNATTDVHTISGSTGVFGNISLTSASSFIDITPQTGSTMGYKIGSNWVVRYDTSRNNFIFGNTGTIYPSATTGNNNFFAGNFGIATGLTTGFGNVAIGFDNSSNEPLRNLTSGFNNIAFGRAALQRLSVGSANIGIGVFSLYLNESGSDNVAIGYSSLQNYTRFGAIGIGFEALTNLAGNDSGDDYPVAIGYTAGRNVSNGRHVLIGYLAGRDMSGAGSDLTTMIGHASGYGLRSSNNDTGIGAFSMGWFNGLGTTEGNVAVGYGAMQLASSSRYMVAVGYEAGYQNGTSTGLGSNDGSVYIGYTAGRATLGNYNVFIGYGAGSSITAASNTFILGNSSTNNLMTGSFSTKRVDFFGSVNAPSFTGSILATGSLNFNGSELSSSWTSYTPTWTSDATQPTLGDGTLTGAYKVIGKTCFVRVRLVYGTTTNSGTGAFYFNLPFSASVSSGIQFPCSILNDGAAWYQATVTGQYGGFTNKTAIIGQSSGANSSEGITGTFPFTFGNLDSIQFNGSYEIA